MNLPIDAYLEAVGAALSRIPALVITAAPGAGKTTRVPRYLLEHDAADSGEIWVLQPRRLAARWAATFVAREIGQTVGERVGYRVRFDDATSAATRLSFVTEGMLLRRLAQNATLPGIGTVVLDEFHGRSVASDVSLALLRNLQRTARPDLRIVVMSATLDAAPVAGFLGGATTLDVPGRQFPVDITHAAHRDDRYLDAQIASALVGLLKDGAADGDVLIFLPGVGEIRRAIAACQALAARHNLLLLPLHGSLTPAEQDLALRPAPQRKIIFATNVAETSVTIDGVTVVIDSGLARQAAHNPWSGMPTLKLGPISQASAAQRAGRAGRTRPGRCIRLYTRADLNNRPAYDTPEIQRLDFSETLLLLYGSGITDPADIDWLEAPSQAAVHAATTLLTRVGAVDGAELTRVGKSMLRFALHPRLSRLVVAAEAAGICDVGCRAAAYLSETEGAASDAPARLSAGSDVLMALLEQKDVGARVAAQLVRQCRGPRGPGVKSPDVEDRLGRALLAAFPDRVARRIAAASRNVPDELLLCGGGRAVLSPGSVVRDAEYVLAIDAAQRQWSGKVRPMVSLAQAIEPDWLLDVEPSAVTERAEVVWNAAQERVEETRGMYYDGLTLDETRSRDVEPERGAQLLAAQVQAAGLGKFLDLDKLATLRARLAVLRQVTPDLSPPPLDDATLGAALVSLCRGRTSFAELRAVDLLAQLESELGAPLQNALRTMTPEYVTLAHGRRLVVHYESGKPPWVESMLQDFFGLSAGPCVGQGRVPLTLHLLAPNRRPVQVTTDLAGFWQRHYPPLKKELSRRYPRHAWPDDPTSARPPEPRRGR